MDKMDKEFLDWIDADIEFAKEQLSSHLLKFNDIELLFKKAKHIIQRYYKEQLEYKNIDTFKRFLEEEITFYIKSFSLSREEKKKIRSKLIEIEKKYSELIYFWDDENNSKSDWIIWTVKWYFWKIIKK